ncbi:PTS system, cellobiose-specific IIC component [Carboxydocella sporoproducens DSM 16521]|uniref:Permease IIC component n=2 Tax=Carboxydocella TaxID=178898 RepID=A0A1T4MTE2_9FIRM|nr:MULTISPECIES: PTS transporter subunit EIIC [Carboxydocella]AVX20336.1 PTS system, cellobiose-specific IIC component [Carboxydocella thermautotrophica]AVX30760.1 PTS system, cellobiose-specific IIC component [Carboxydocella thermautotrophica]SJZ70252.1 PTS system, cellobiose-specific IIC component [Carboxydocella sporoproducens DSM 16521]
MVNWLELKFLPFAVKLAENRYLQAVRDAFIGYGLPMILLGSFFLLLANPPLPAAWLPRQWFQLNTTLLVIFNATFGLLSLWIAWGTANALAAYYRLDRERIALTATAVFVAGSFPARPVVATVENWLTELGPQGLLFAVLCAILTVEIFRWFQQKGWLLRLPKGVPAGIARTLAILLPAGFVLTLIWLSRLLLAVGLGQADLTWSAAVRQLITPLVRASDTYWSALLQILVMMLLWSVGLHGMNLVSAIAYPLWAANLSENFSWSLAQPGTVLPHIVTEPFYHIFAHLGGSGATMPLVIYLLKSKSKTLRQVGRVALLPALFNINEPITFGVPLALNPVMIIPFILAPAMIVTVNYWAMAWGWVARPLYQLPFTVPVLFSGYLSNGHISGTVLQAVDLLLAALIYWPFFRLWETKVLHTEAEQSDTLK